MFLGHFQKHFISIFHCFAMRRQLFHTLTFDLLLCISTRENVIIGKYFMQKMQKKTTKLATLATTLGLNMSPSNPKAMSINQTTDNTINLDRIYTGRSNIFTDLGSVIGKDGGSDRQTNKNREGKNIFFNVKANMDLQDNFNKK